MKPNEIAEQKEDIAFEYPIVGKSKAVEQLLKDIQRLAEADRDVVIVG